MKLLDILKNIDYEMIQGANVEIGGIVIDSRKVQSNYIYVCIDGLHVDGHNFINQAVKLGAKAILVTKQVENIPAGIAVIKVENSRHALSILSGNFYGWPSRNYPLIGVTGTNGKTSCTYFLEAILNEYGHKCGVIGTVSTRVGNKEVNTKFNTSTTPDPVELQQIFAEMAESKVNEVVMEVTSHALELHKIDGLHFNISIFTNLTQDHLDLHGNMENYKQAKAKLFKISDTAIINMDNEYGQFFVESATGKVITYGIEAECDLQAKNVCYTSHGVSFEVDNTYFEIPVPGKFTVYNVLGVIGASLQYGVPMEIIQKALKGIKGVPGRIQSIANNKGIGVYVDYAHTPDSLENIITAVREFTSGRIITVFGCGGDRDKTKRPIMGKIAAEHSDYCVITSDNPRTENPDTILAEIEEGVQLLHTPYTMLADRKEAIYFAIGMVKKEDAVIIAGKGHENYQIFLYGTVHFDDAEVALEALNTGVSNG